MGGNPFGAFSVTLTLTEARAVECVSAGPVHTHRLLMLNRHQRWNFTMELYKVRLQNLFQGLSCRVHFL